METECSIILLFIVVCILVAAAMVIEEEVVRACEAFSFDEDDDNKNFQVAFKTTKALESYKNALKESKTKKAKRMPSDIGNTILPFMKETASSKAQAVKKETKQVKTARKDVQPFGVASKSTKAVTTYAELT